ncbi:hypothetical protein G6F68_014470 [Rhizopus microsporus]|nr:hypothetical protein G6F68_014470 [Rhizopus microsporus]
MKKIVVTTASALPLVTAGALPEEPDGRGVAEIGMRYAPRCAEGRCCVEGVYGRNQFGRAALLSRMRSCTGATVRRGGASGSSSRCSSRAAACRPRSRGSAVSVVNGGTATDASEISSKPVTAKSPPGRMPREFRPSIRPSATVSL